MQVENMGDSSINLPPGFRFHPTDEELILHFLHHKVASLPCYPNIIPQLDLYSSDPWELHGKALWNDNEWYFFSQKIEDRVTRNGYWKQLGNNNDEEEVPIFTSTGKKVGIKKHFEFYIGQTPGGVGTAWTMQEYHLCSSGLLITQPSKRRRNHEVDINNWVLCRVHERTATPRESYRHDEDGEGAELSSMDEIFLSVDDDDDQDEISFPRVRSPSVSR